MKAHATVLHSILIGLLTSSLTFAAQSKNPIEAAREAWKKAREQQRQPKEQGEPQQQRQQKPGQKQAPGQAQAADTGPIVPPAGTKIEETVLAPVQQGAHFSISPRGVHAAATGSSGSRQVVIYEGVEGPKFDEIFGQGRSQVVFSPDGKRYAYCARSGNEFVVMVDGKELARSSESQGGRFDGNLCALGFTSNSKHVYYTTGNVTPASGYRYSRFVFDGKPGPPNEDSRGIPFPALSPDGEHFAYIWNDPAKQKPWALIVDGKPAGYQGSNPQWSADSQHLFTQIQFPMGPGRGMGTEVLLDGKPIMRAQGVQLFIPPVGDMVIAQVSAPIPSHVVFLTVRGKKIPGSDTDGQAGGIDQIVFSADGKHFAAKYRTSTNTQYVMVDGKKGLEYQFVDKLSFTADSTKVVYQASNGGKSFVIVGDQESDGAPGLMEPVIAPAGNRVGSFHGGSAPQLFMDGKTTRIDGRAIEKLSFSPDGAHYAYLAYDAGMGRRLVLDGIPQPASNLGPSNAPVDGKYVFSSDGKHIAHFALPPTPTGDGERGLFLDGKYVPLGQGLICSQLTFTPDGRHLFWLQQVPSQNRIRVFADGKPIAETYQANNLAVMPGWSDFSPEGTFSFLGQDDTSLKRISITPSPETSLETLLTRAR